VRTAHSTGEGEEEEEEEEEEVDWQQQRGRRDRHTRGTRREKGTEEGERGVSQ
jgi:hypothetical protein